MLSAVVAALSISSCGSFDLNQWCQNNASNRMIGIGIPGSQSKTPRPKPMVALMIEPSFPTKPFCRKLNADACFGFHLWNWRFHRWSAGHLMDSIP
jgi:hypothetical protein